MDTLNLSERYWKGSSETSPQHGGGVGQPFRQSTTWRAHIPSVESLLARVRGNRTDRPGQVQNRRRWVFSRESSRVAAVIPVTISGIDEHDRIFREATQTIDVSRRGARIATSNALAVGTYLRIESPSMEKPTVAQVVRYCVRSHPDCTREICVALLDVVETHNIWGIQSPPEDWQTGLGEPTAAQRLGHILGCEWAARFKSISKVAAPPTGFAMGRESQPKPAPASLKPEVPPSSSEKGSGEGPVSVTSQPEEPVRVSASTLVCGDEGVLSGPDQIRKVPTSDVEERLTEVSLAVKALEGRVGTLVDRVGALVEDFQGRIEGTLQAFQGKGARQAEDLEKMAQDLGGRWSQQFQGQAEAAVERLREELKSSGRVVEEGKRQLASLAEAKLASLSQATREEYGQQLAQAFREHAQVMHEAADEEVESIKLAAEQAIAQLQAAEEKRETSFTARAGAAEECLTGVSLAVEALEGRLGALVEDFQGRIEGTLRAFQGQGARQAGDLERMAQDMGGRWSQQFEEQAGAAVERLREELKSSGRAVEESKRELASLAKAKLLALSKVADNAAAGLEAEQRRLKNQYETSRRELEDLLKRGWTKPPSLSLQRGNRPKRRRIVAQPALVAGVCLLIMVPLLSVYLPKAHVMQLQPEAPAEFIDQSPYWSAERRAREEEVAQAYWRAAVVGLQERYPFGSELPAEPPTEFQVENEYIAPGGAKAFFETRARYWENLRRSWVQPQFWVERPERNTQWAARLRQIWDHLHPPK